MTITWELILGVAGGIVVLYNASKVFVSATSPFKTLKDKIKKHDEILDKDNERLKVIEESNKIICKSMIALLEHEITGNSIEKLRTVKKELQDYIIER